MVVATLWLGPLVALSEFTPSESRLEGWLILSCDDLRAGRSRFRLAGAPTDSEVAPGACMDVPINGPPEPVDAEPARPLPPHDADDGALAEGCADSAAEGEGASTEGGASVADTHGAVSADFGVKVGCLTHCNLPLVPLAPALTFRMQTALAEQEWADKPIFRPACLVPPRTSTFATRARARRMGTYRYRSSCQQNSTWSFARRWRRPPLVVLSLSHGQAR